MKRYTDKPDNSVSPPDSLQQTTTPENDAQEAPTGEPIEQEEDVVEQQVTPSDEHEEYVPEQADEQPRQATPPTRIRLFTALSFWGVVLLGALLRFVGLGNRPLHHDESLHGYFSMILLHNNIQNWSACFNAPPNTCYRYDPLLHGPFQFHAIALVYQLSQWLGVPDHGINTTTVRIAAALAGTAIVGLPYFLRDRLTTLGAWLACLLLAISPSMLYYSRFAREDIYMACFTLLLVVALARYLRTRKAGWLVTAALAFALSYATKESTFFTIGIFGSFFGALVFWELGKRHRSPIAAPTTDISQGDDREPPTAIPFWKRTAAPWVLLGYLVVFGIVALLGLRWLKNLSVYISASKANTQTANIFVDHLKTVTEQVIPWLGILLAIVVFYLLFREYYGKKPEGERRGLARLVDPKRQPLLDTLATMPWTHWFFALILGWIVFLVLFTALFTYIPQGIGDGIWQGIYYWITQQQVARGSQPWYYYFMLIPLYEQIGLVFGCIGVVRCLKHPTRFRLFLLYWFFANVAVYTWAGEKMPWLIIHMTMPMLILAAIGLEPFIRRLAATVRAWLPRFNGQTSTEAAIIAVRPRPWPVASSAIKVLLTLLLLALTLQNMIQVNYVHPADATHEMLIYVQTTPNVNTVMNKINALDQQLYGGKHKLPIGITSDAAWPYAWYLRDYTSTCYNYPTNCSISANKIQVIVTGGDDVPGYETQYGQQYNFHAYEMRSQWDQGYMPPPCVHSSTNACTDPQPYIGVGPLLWLSYGNNPPKGAIFNPALATQHIWQWWWQRRPFGGVDQGYQMVLFIRKGISAQP